MKGLLRHRLLIHSERARKLVGDLLVDGDDVDVSVKERITEDDTADTTLDGLRVWVYAGQNEGGMGMVLTETRSSEGGCNQRALRMRRG